MKKDDDFSSIGESLPSVKNKDSLSDLGWDDDAKKDPKHISGKMDIVTFGKKPANGLEGRN